ncbi:SGNH/GDSL hydrolase family protein [Nocardia sp. NPDC051030]|uniref:SGNH/GDSL hydrolase family protein n=1 Tax=Nocardia sp. NPDC051030 TaxID=3155162 RepID=UPI00343E6EAA
MSHTDIHVEADNPWILSDTAGTALLHDVPWRRFAVIGDSTAAGTGDPVPGYETLPWADRIARWLSTAHPDTSYLNTGRVGALIAEVRTEQLPALDDFRPDLVYVTCGGNDLFRRGADLATVEAELDELCSAATETGARLALFTMADAFTGKMTPLQPLFAQFADSVRRIATRHDAILTEFWNHPARLRPDWLSADLIHLSMAGHAVVAAEIARSFAQTANADQSSRLVH